MDVPDDELDVDDELVELEVELEPDEVEPDALAAVVVVVDWVDAVVADVDAVPELDSEEVDEVPEFEVVPLPEEVVEAVPALVRRLADVVVPDEAVEDVPVPQAASSPVIPRVAVTLRAPETIRARRAG